ncbi:MAG: amidohydrolase family protein [Desulfatitalea sp.]|nr:amidohydrolase family protein [Desulfatitalea sp.]NNK01240.1 amidohydrolase family protein [Desulfatitalea sp.]
MNTNHQAWLAKVKEEAIDPDLPIIDAHHHFLNLPDNRYLLDEILQDTNSGHNVVQTIFVESAAMYRTVGPEALRPVGETEFVRRIAEGSEAVFPAMTRVAAGIVGFADLTLGADVLPVLEAHIAAADGRFRGIRHAVGWDAADSIPNAHTNPPRGLMSDSTFRLGFSMLNRYDLSFDARIYHPQLEEFAELARLFPETAIILDHVGGPLGIGPYAGKHKAVFDQWRRGIDQAATCDNVAVKLGGLAMKLCGFRWHEQPAPPTSAVLAEAMRPFFEYCIERFGVERCMFESNFPTDKPSCAYAVLWNAYKRITQSYSEHERAALFYGTASQVYGLDETELD